MSHRDSDVGVRRCGFQSKWDSPLIGRIDSLPSAARLAAAASADRQAWCAWRRGAPSRADCDAHGRYIRALDRAIAGLDLDWRLSVAIDGAENGNGIRLPARVVSNDVDGRNPALPCCSGHCALSRELGRPHIGEAAMQVHLGSRTRPFQSLGALTMIGSSDAQ